MKVTSSASSSSSSSWLLSQPEDRLLWSRSYFSNGYGTVNEGYSVAWRYLGMYIDCDTTSSNNYYSYGDDCSRKVLWAAYEDPGYQGGTIGEYQYYDWTTDTWDNSTCQTSRCAKMDCHVSSTQWQLIGVFKETNGIEQWAEQLFKHHGYCTWDGDKDYYSGTGNYKFMQAMREEWVETCTELDLKDSDGNTLYRDLKPQAGGNMTDALYYDSKCTKEATMSWSEYIVDWFSYNYNDEEDGEDVAEEWMAGIERWNELMTSYKICQPCRTFNKVPTYKNYNANNRQRHLGNSLQDGEGYREQWGYNCFDDAGYRNCNQCYKFESKTDMELASLSDLKRASEQGTILPIYVNGVMYGEGGSDVYGEVESAVLSINHVSYVDEYNEMPAGLIFAVFAILGITVACCWLQIRRCMFKKDKSYVACLKKTTRGSRYRVRDENNKKESLIEMHCNDFEHFQEQLDHICANQETDISVASGMNNGNKGSLQGVPTEIDITAQKDAIVDPSAPGNLDATCKVTSEDLVEALNAAMTEVAHFKPFNGFQQPDGAEANVKQLT